MIFLTLLLIAILILTLYASITYRSYDSQAIILIEELRYEEGASVQILCDNPEAESNDLLMAVECKGTWTGWEYRRFYGAILLDCLTKAHAEYLKFQAKSL